MEPVNFAVVGLGMGHVRAKTVQQTEGAHLSCVVDLDIERARSNGEEYGCPWYLTLGDALDKHPEIDCVFVLTETGRHAEVGIQAARAGKHVITTKPMDVSAAACTKLIRECERRGVKLLVDFQSRYVDGNIQLVHAVHEGWLGRPLIGEFRFKWWRDAHYFKAQGGWRGTWRWDGGGSLANQGIHGLDLLTWVMGDVDEVYAQMAILDHEIETEDATFVILKFANGARGAITTTTTFPGQSPYYSLEVHGTEGGVLLDSALGGTGRYFVPDEVKRKMEAIPNPVHSIIEDAVQVIRHGKTAAVDGREGRRTVHLLESIYRSARSGRRVKVTPLKD